MRAVAGASPLHWGLAARGLMGPIALWWSGRRASQRAPRTEASCHAAACIQRETYGPSACRRQAEANRRVESHDGAATVGMSACGHARGQGAADKKRSTRRISTRTFTASVNNVAIAPAIPLRAQPVQLEEMRPVPKRVGESGSVAAGESTPRVAAIAEHHCGNDRLPICRSARPVSCMRTSWRLGGHSMIPCMPVLSTT
jgi:hypothetical protein